MSTTTPAALPATPTLAGVVEIVHGEPKPTWTAGKLRTTSGELVRFKVKAFLRVGDAVTLRGAWEDSAKWGPQYAATDATCNLPATDAGLALWLSKNGKFIGPKKAFTLVEQFGAADVMQVFLTSPQRIADAIRVPLTSVKDVAEMWEKYHARITAITHIAEFGVPYHLCEAIVTEYGSTAVSHVMHDPYSLVGEVDGIGFKSADEIAARVGIVGADPRRLRGAVQAFVRERYDNGHTATPLPLACERTAALLESTPDAVRSVLDVVVSAKRLMRLGTGSDQRDVLVSPLAYHHERAVWEFLRSSRQRNPIRVCREGEEERYAEDYRQCGDKMLDDSQFEGLRNAILYRVSALSGGAGSGKSTMSRAIVKAFRSQGIGVHLCAPTGRAARRLSEIIGMDAHTIHKLLQWNGKDAAFMYNARNRLPEGLYVCDELSMCDASIMFHFLTALPERSCLVLVGDVQQLPPVGPGAVLRDILKYDLAPTTRLQFCHRQAGALKRNCSAILTGNVMPTAAEHSPAPWVLEDRLDTDEKVIDGIKRLYLKLLPAWQFAANDWVFLAPKLDGPLGVKRINLGLQYLHQRHLGNAIPAPEKDDWRERPTFYIGDKVLQTKNAYQLNEGRGVMNGTMGVVHAVEPELVIDYDDVLVTYTSGESRDVNLAYCLTVHRVQGAQVPCAIVVVPKGSGGFVTRNLLYTGVTRAEKCAVLMGDGPTIRTAASRTSDDERETVLAYLAQHEE